MTTEKPSKDKNRRKTWVNRVLEKPGFIELKPMGVLAQIPDV